MGIRLHSIFDTILTGFQSADQLTWNTLSVYRNIMYISIAELFTGFIYLLWYYTCMCACANIHNIIIHMYTLYMRLYVCVYV